ncbi:hypothetical protein [Azonexus sp.]|jgi:hypothetical protein|uniref:hypothetical protein n=1 Tax=Azonexus sp. TaxID=1872668 RepID=UPI00282F887B|nr:hypothetical protein [Azonexus sp.]MDR1994769.1 hypothetical protein [Azonexus sp.]
MSTAAPIPADPLADLADADLQRLAARMAQDVFAGIFRLAVEPDGERDAVVLGEVAERCFNWSRAGSDEAARALRLALLVSGLDQWGLAYTQAFQLAAIPPLSALLGNLRNRLDATADARFLQYFATLNDCEAAAIDFKIELRRAIHLALWHAMAACETTAQVEAIVRPLGSLMLGLNERMPELGWRLLADALASIQMALLAAPNGASAQAQEGTQQLFASLRHALPAERYQAILAHSGQAVLAWQQAQRAQAGQEGRA